MFPAIVAAVLTYGLVADPGQIRDQVRGLTAAGPASGRELLLEQLDALTSAPRHSERTAAVRPTGPGGVGA